MTDLRAERYRCNEIRHELRSADQLLAQVENGEVKGYDAAVRMYMAKRKLSDALKAVELTLSTMPKRDLLPPEQRV